jgi:hypothetical protein
LVRNSSLKSFQETWKQRKIEKLYTVFRPFCWAMKFIGLVLSTSNWEVNGDNILKWMGTTIWQKKEWTFCLFVCFGSGV